MACTWFMQYSATTRRPCLILYCDETLSKFVKIRNNLLLFVFVSLSWIPVRWAIWLLWWPQTRLGFYQTRSAWSMDQWSNKNHSPINNFTPTFTKFCVMWEGQALPHEAKFHNCAGKIVDSRVFPSWSFDTWIKLIWFDISRARCLDNITLVI